MKKPHQLAREIQEYCAAHADAKLAKKYERYFKEGYDAWGLLDKNHPFFNERKAQWLEDYHGIGVPGFIEAGEKLFASGKYEEGAISIGFLKAQYDRLDESAGLALGRWFEAGLCNWAHADVLCGELLGPMLADGRLSLEALGPWRSSPLRFQRRAVPVSMLALLPKLKKGEEPTPADRRRVKKLLEFVRPMMLDDERVVHQGLGWFLREAWKKCPADVEAFLLPFKDSAARLIFQYATEKMTPAGKARFRASKPARGRKAIAAASSGRA